VQGIPHTTILNGQPAAILTEGGIVVGAIVLDVMDGSIVGVRVVRNPDKLVRLTAHPPGSAAPGLASPTT
jgi:hypothetical protein